jgi:hypothetical protein
VSDLGDRLVDAYRGYVLQRCTERRWAHSARLLASLTEGEAWLRASLAGLLDLPFGDQRRGPLEVFQEAMRFPTEALAADRVPEPVRDETASRALPGDVYDLAPASTRLLGDDVWEAHMTWGAEKAAAVTRPVVLVATRSLVDWSRIEEAAGAASMRATRWSGSIGSAALVCVDLELDDAMGIVKAGVAEGVSVVAYGPHRAVGMLGAARTAGASHVLARSAFFARLDLPRWVS